MEMISDQIDSIKDRFNTKKIFDKTTKARLTETQVEGIIYVLKTERADGIYVVDDDITVLLQNGTCSIIDNDE